MHNRRFDHFILYCICAFTILTEKKRGNQMEIYAFSNYSSKSILQKNPLCIRGWEHVLWRHADLKTQHSNWLVPCQHSIFSSMLGNLQRSAHVLALAGWVGWGRKASRSKNSRRFAERTRCGGVEVKETPGNGHFLEREAGINGKVKTLSLAENVK